MFALLVYVPIVVLYILDFVSVGCYFLHSIVLQFTCSISSSTFYHGHISWFPTRSIPSLLRTIVVFFIEIIIIITISSNCFITSLPFRLLLWHSWHIISISYFYEYIHDQNQQEQILCPFPTALAPSVSIQFDQNYIVV